jgi:enediyne biosynthesis protein E4
MPRLAGLDSATVALFFDCNNDGHPDLFAGRVLSRDKLYRNNGDGTFTDISKAADVNRVGWGWGDNVLDFDDNGRLDIFAVNGWITAKNGTVL